jgi:hypothetical protein
MSDVTLVAGNRDTGVDFIYAGSAPYQFEPSQAAGTAASLSDGLVVTFNITTGSAKGSFDLLIANVFSNDKAGNEIVPTYTGLTGIQIVPEPITVALLGLGGLFIRRRKVA